MKPMATNGGAHPADKWADHAVDAILDLVEIKEDSTSPEATAARQAKRDLRPVLFGIINGHLDATQKAEQTLPAKVKTPEAARAHAWDIKIANDVLDGIVAEVTAAIAKTSFGDHFAKDAPQTVLRALIGQSMADVMHIERRYHHDRLTAAAATAKGA